MFALKLSLVKEGNSQSRRVSLNEPLLLSFDRLVSLTRELFTLDNSLFLLSWNDDENEAITVSSDEEITEAVDVMIKQNLKCIKFQVSLQSSANQDLLPLDRLPATPSQDDYHCTQCSKSIVGVRYQIFSSPSILYCEKCEHSNSCQLPKIKIYHPDQHFAADIFLVERRKTEKKSSTLKPTRDCLTPQISLSPRHGMDQERWGRVGYDDTYSPKNLRGVKALETSSESSSSSFTRSSFSQSFSSSAPSNASNRAHGGKHMCRFMRPSSFSDGEKLLPNTPFAKTWRVLNDGVSAWSSGSCVCDSGGDKMFLGDTYSVAVPQLRPGEEGDITVQLVSPSLSGRHVAYFRLRTASGKYFGQRLWADIRVIEPEEAGRIGDIPVHIPAPAPAPEIERGSSSVSTSALLSEVSSPACSIRPWGEELSALAKMGFTDESRALACLHKYAHDERTNAKRATHQLLQMTVTELLG